jgi:hypothetical protein
MPRSWEEGEIQWYDGAIAIWTLIKYRFLYQDNPDTTHPNESKITGSKPTLKSDDESIG